MDDIQERAPDGAVCPYCGVRLTPENVFNRQEGTAPAIVGTDVPGVDEEVEDVPVYVAQCMDCLLANQETK